ncbi:hypothetical protein BC937DRAFT_91201 [Endogone sp. FLAS-F59071]|nr:hypothetical protein BC937DRAFT_91201 [Endogone sp. FLAS-F59071]|eukprot:RUS16430.1 hypothetical protein BC937DRAFT_91201 [Endogone sp. FLAS-F59071]
MPPAKRHRQIAVESDDEDPPSLSSPAPQEPKRQSIKPTHSKRARYHSEDNGESLDMSYANGDDAVGEEDDDESEEFDMSMDNEDVSMMEQEIEFKRSKQGTHGEPAESGVIEKIVLTNFMCHKYLEVRFGPKLNFIIGHNGSGKSAILTGIIVALGAKATVTNRASNIKSLIREGASACQVSLTIKNCGPDAYRPDIYGDRITIERRIAKEGSSGYKIKANDGRTISTKRDELIAICDYMAIQVDNPLTILSQDTARQFLQTASPEEKFKFYMKGTELRQLCEDYAVIRESIDTTKEIIKRKKTTLPDLERESTEACAKLKNLRDAHLLEQQLQDLKNETCWAQIEDKEAQVVKVEQDKLKAQSKLPEINIKLNDERQKLEEIEQAIAELEAQSSVKTESARPINEQRKRLMEGMKERKRELAEYDAEGKEMNDNIKALRLTVGQLQQRIGEETRKLEVDGQRKRDAILAQIAGLEVEINAARQETNQKRQELDQNNSEIEQLTQSERNARDEINRIRNTIVTTETTIRDLRGQQENRVRAFGNQMPEILRDIDRERGFHKRPLGPIGMYIRVSNPEWIPVMESLLGGSLNTFLCENYADKNLLMTIFRRHNFFPNVSIYRRDMFDFSGGQPDPRFLTVLNVLEFDDEWVKRFIVDDRRIESIILVNERREGDEIMLTRPPRVTRCISKDNYELGTKAGMQTRPMREYRGRPRFIIDVEPQIREANETLQELQRKLHQEQERVQEIGRKLQALQRQKNILKREAQATENTARNGHNRVEQLQDQLQQEEPANIQALEESKQLQQTIQISIILNDKSQESERQIEMILNQFRELSDRKEQLQAENEPTQARVDELNKQLDLMNARNEAIREEIEGKYPIRMDAQNKVSHWERKQAEQDERIRVLQQEHDRQRNELQEWMAQAVEYCPERVEVTRTKEQLNREVTLLSARIKERNNEHGVDLEEVAINATNKTRAYKVAQNEMEMLEILVKGLGNALAKRLSRLDDYKKYIAMRVHYIFMYHLSTRNFKGDMKISYKNERLKIKITSGDADQKHVTRDKDPKSLSGGEKSFSTLCLLLSIWASVASPIRCLDEFDVFMDAVNRQMSMAMVIEAAEESTGVQYILITPQDARGIIPGPNTRVHRLADPERNQTVLDL